MKNFKIKKSKLVCAFITCLLLAVCFSPIVIGYYQEYSNETTNPLILSQLDEGIKNIFDENNQYYYNEVYPLEIISIDTLQRSTNGFYPSHSKIKNVYETDYEPESRYVLKSISGGLGFTVTIENSGLNDTEDVDWTIEMDGFILIGQEKQGTIISFPSNEQRMIRSGFIFGFGPVTISIIVDGHRFIATALLVGPVVINPTLLTVDEQPVLHIEEVCPVQTNILAIRIETGVFSYGTQEPYDSQPGDEILLWGHNRWISRNDEIIGSLVGPDEDLMFTFDELTGVYPREFLPSSPQEVEINSNDHETNQSFHPLRISKKTRPTNLVRTNPWEFEATLSHTLYLQLPSDLTVETTYKIDFVDNYLDSIIYTYQPRQQHSEAVHVSQIGFRPDDPVKIAFLSSWMGDGGPVEYDEGMSFEIIDEGTDEIIFSGTTKLSLSKGSTEDEYGKNYAGTDVYYMDFSSVTRPGRYRVYVDDIGCSLSFPISETVWQDAFKISTRGLYHQRSGIELGPPYTNFHRPRCFHPDDGIVVYASTTPLMDTGNGLKEGADNFKDLVEGKTDEVVSDVWGGTMDAGDWDRRIQHLDASRLLLDLALFFPAFASDIDLNIPESLSNLPDIVDEALWNVDFYKRLQTPEGGIRGGIESEEHPRYGEMSWQESLTVLAYAPGVWSSYLYAGVASQASQIVSCYDADRANEYLQSALHAMQWAENELPNRQDINDPHQVNDARNLAAAELYRATSDERWHQLFLNTTVFSDPDSDVYLWESHDQADAAWVYVLTQNHSVDPVVYENCFNALIRDADQREQMASSTSYRFTKRPYYPVIGGVFSSPLESVPLIRAHKLTGEENYLSAAILSCQMGAGANPLNICYTTGVGSTYPENVLHLDSRIRCLPAPTGLTALGPLDHEFFGKDLIVGVDPFIYPVMNQWPVAEFFFDVFWLPMITEFTIHIPMASNIYVWGYLAARS